MTGQTMLRLAAASAALVALAPTVGAAQAVRFDTATAHAYTIDALIGASRTSATLVRGVPAAARALEIVDRILARVDRPAVTRLPLDVLARSQVRAGDAPQATFGQVARFRRREVVPGLGAGDAADLDSLTRLTVAELQRAMEARQPPVPDDSIDTILAPLTALHLNELQVSIAQSLEKLNRFERKYGPDSPRLNVVEVGLNYVAQWVPLFKPNTEGWPSRFELVTSYVPLYLTVVDGNARPVTIAELGLRSYFWQRGWGGSEGARCGPAISRLVWRWRATGTAPSSPRSRGRAASADSSGGATPSLRCSAGRSGGCSSRASSRWCLGCSESSDAEPTVGLIRPATKQ